jgi:hypothetical protein
VTSFTRPSAPRLVTAHHAFAHQEVEGPLHAEVLDEQPVSTFIGLPTHAERRCYPAGPTRSHREIARETIETELDRAAVHGGDRDLVEARIARTGSCA